MALSENSEVKQKERPWLFQKGTSGNPAGKPKGSKHKLGEAFVVALHEDFLEHGIAAIQEVRRENPAQYLSVIARVIPKDLNINLETFQNVTDEQLALIIDAATRALNIVEGSAEDITDSQGGKPAQALLAVSETG